MSCKDLITEYFQMNGRGYMSREVVETAKEEQKTRREQRHKDIVHALVILYKLLKEEC